MPQKESIDSDGLVEFSLIHKNSFIRVLADIDLREETEALLEKHYQELEAYCLKEPYFLVSYTPVKPIPEKPEIARIMTEASYAAGVGPMASVAGAFSELLGRFMLSQGAEEVIVDNGGDIFMKLRRQRLIGVYASSSVFSQRIGFKVKPEETPLAVCTSSSSVGHSISFGDADAVSAVAESCALADAAATAVGNIVKGQRGLSEGIEAAKKIRGLKGVLIIRGNEFGVWGRLPEIVRL